jgi:hypothetical protein
VGREALAQLVNIFSEYYDMQVLSASPPPVGTGFAPRGGAATSPGRSVRSPAALPHGRAGTIQVVQFLIPGSRPALLPCLAASSGVASGVGAFAGTRLHGATGGGSWAEGAPKRARAEPLADRCCVRSA